LGTGSCLPIRYTPPVTEGNPDLDATRTATEKSIHHGQTLAAATSVGRYMVLSKIGAGGMGEVYAAYDPKLDRRVALKMLHCLESKADAERLIREARALARLSHPHVVTVHEVDELAEMGGQPLIVMEFVDGRTLKQWIRRPTHSTWSIVERLDLLVQAGKGLVAAHAEGLIHRDFKPSNVLIGTDRRARVADFGLAIGVGEPRPPGQHVDGADSVDSSLTKTGVLIGTPAYMAPEQFAGKTVDARCDQFSFCVTAWEALFGTRPYTSTRSDGQGVRAFRAGAVNRPEGAQVPANVETTLRKGLSVRPGARFGTMTELVEELETELNILRGEEMPRRKFRGWRLLGIAAFAAIAVWGLARAHKGRLASACEDQGAEIDGTWNEDIRDEVLTSLRSTQEGALIHDEDRLSPWLDEHSAALREATVDACRHSTVDKDWDAALVDKSQWCLQERRFEFEEVIEAYREGGEWNARLAVDWAVSLKPVSPCLDPRALVELEVPPEEERAELRELQRRLSQASRLGADSQEEQLSIVREVGRRASELDWKPMLTHVGREEGSILVGLGDADAGTEAWREAWFQAAESSDWRAAVRIARDISWVASNGDINLDKSRLWLALGHVCLKQTYDPSGRFESSLLEAQVGLESTAANMEEAERLGRLLLERKQRLFGIAHYETADALSLLGAVLQKRGNYSEAASLKKRGLEIQLRTFGGNRVKISNDYLGLAQTQRFLGEFTEARENARKAHEVMLRTSPKNPQLAYILLARAISALDAGDFPDGVVQAEEALRLAEEAYEDGHSNTIDILASVADFRRLDGRLQDAVLLYQRSEKIARNSLGPTHMQTLYPKARICLLLGELGRRDEAITQCRELESALSEVKSTGPQDAQRFAQMSLGFVNLGLASDAVRWGRRAVDACQEAFGVQSGAAAAAKVFLAQGLALGGFHDEARRTADNALAIARGVDVKVATDDFATLLAGRAFVYSRAGEYDIALADYREASIRSQYKGRVATYRKAVANLCSEHLYQPACK